MSDARLGKYRIIAELGRGGMAEVYLAVTENQEVSFNKLVVLKKLREELSGDPEFVTMFMDEARLAARLNHPNVVQTLEVTRAGAHLALAMEYLDGQPFHRLQQRKGGVPLPVPMQLAVLSDVLAGIHYAHEVKDFDGKPLAIVHRDVTPQNVFVTYDGHVKVVDFGIAKAVGRSVQTRQGVIKGKVSYMSPEQARAGEVDRRTDVFAVGVMLFEACTGRRLWAGAKEVDVLRGLIRHDFVTSPREAGADIHPELDRICRKALAPLVDDRYATALEMQTDLDAYIEAHGSRPGPRQIGAWVAKEFEDRRKHVQGVIEKQIADLATSRLTNIAELHDPALGSDAGISITVSMGTASEKQTRIAPPPSDMGEAEPEEGDAGREAAPPRSGSRSKWGIAGVAALVVLGGVVLLTRTNPSTSAASSPTRGEVVLTLRATPLETTFRIDDGPPLENPYVGRFPRDAREHVVRATAPGHRTQTQSVTLSQDTSLRFALSRADAGGP